MTVEKGEFNSHNTSLESSTSAGLGGGALKLVTPGVDRQTPYEELGGLVRPETGDTEAVSTERPVRKLLVADPEARAKIDTTRQPEIARAYDLALDTLTREQLGKLLPTERRRLVVAVMSLVERIQSRIRTLSTKGGIDDDRFKEYGFIEQSEADEYVAKLRILLYEIEQSEELMIDIRSKYAAIGESQRRFWRTRVGNLSVSVIDDKNVEILGGDVVSPAQKLRATG